MAQSQHLQALCIDGFGLPRGLGEQPLQALGMGMLRADDGFSVGEGGEGLVAFGGQEQAFELAAEGVTLIAFGQARGEAVGVGLKWSRCGRNR